MIGNLSDIDIRLLRIFLTVADSGSFSLAATRLNIGESTISSQMTDLETRLGFRLCDRGRSGFRLTAKGEHVHRLTLSLLSSIDNYRDQLAQVSSQFDIIRLGLPDGIASNPEIPVASWISRLAGKFSGIKIELTLSNPRLSEQLVLTERLHAAIVPVHRPVAGLTYRTIGTELNLMYCGSNWLLSAQSEEALADEATRSGRLISRGYLEEFDSEFFQGFEHRATVTEVEAALLLVQSNEFIGFLPKHFADPHVQLGSIKPLLTNKFKLTIEFALIFLKSLEDDRRITELLACIREKANPTRI